MAMIHKRSASCLRIADCWKITEGFDLLEKTSRCGIPVGTEEPKSHDERFVLHPTFYYRISLEQFVPQGALLLEGQFPTNAKAISMCLRNFILFDWPSVGFTGLTASGAIGKMPIGRTNERKPVMEIKVNSEA